VRIFGADATANRVQPFASHFLTQTRAAFAQMPAADNPFLQQILLGSFLRPMWPWLQAATDALPETQFTQAAMSDVLAAEPAGAYDLIHLSNILDWIKPAQAARVLSDSRRCLAAGGMVVIRQLNSRLDIRSLDSGLRWISDWSDQLHRSDRSFFYRALHVGANR
jgi:S-adenosylmethionine-diacylglycerol 3-amino-3-carboxypropyl transferase